MIDKAIRNRMSEVQDRIVEDLNRMGVLRNVTGYSLSVKTYSKTCFGRYYPRTDNIFVYLYEDTALTKERPYDELFRTVLHEITHYIQYHDAFFIRARGVMHNEEFYHILNDLVREAECEEIIE